MFCVFDTIAQSFSLEKSSEKIILEKIVSVCEEVSYAIDLCMHMYMYTYIDIYYVYIKTLKIGECKYNTRNSW